MEHAEPDRPDPRDAGRRFHARGFRRRSASIWKEAALSPGAARPKPDYGRALWFDAYAGGTIFRHVVHPLFVQTIVNPNIKKVPGDKAVIDNVLDKVQPKSSAISSPRSTGKFLVGDA